MASSLEKLVDATDKSDFKITNSAFGKQANLLLRKGIYPYEYMDSQERFNETQLPPIDKFYSSLTYENISPEDYEHAQKVWKDFNCKTLADYLDLYLRTDVVLLADVFQTFSKMCMNAYKLDTLHYYTSPGLSWDALLKYTQIYLELLTDIDMHLLVDIKTKDVYKDMAVMKDEYDFYDYPKDHPLYDETNKKVLGKMKDECVGTPIAEYIGLRPKLYSILRADEQLIEKAKGVKKYVIKKQINFENYKDVLFNKKSYTHDINMLRSMRHKIYGPTMNKTTLYMIRLVKYLNTAYF